MVPVGHFHHGSREEWTPNRVWFCWPHFMIEGDRAQWILEYYKGCIWKFMRNSLCKVSVRKTLFSPINISMHIHLQAKKSKNEVWITHFIYTDPAEGLVAKISHFFQYSCKNSMMLQVNYNIIITIQQCILEREVYILKIRQFQLNLNRIFTLTCWCTIFLHMLM